VAVPVDIVKTGNCSGAAGCCFFSEQLNRHMSRNSNKEFFMALIF
jgi:hypothetical protein